MFRNRLSLDLNMFAYPLRVARRVTSVCRICHKLIRVGDAYYDGGRDCRAHKSCAKEGYDKRRSKPGENS